MQSLIIFVALFFAGLRSALANKEMLDFATVETWREVFIPCLRMDYAFREPLKARPTELYNCHESEHGFCVCYDKLE